jgi:hypothetical protein
MARAKDIEVRPINRKLADSFVRKHHYSGKVAASSQLHLGVFLDEVLHGVMQFGGSMDKRKLLPLVKDTKWNGYLELNRMAFDDVLPRNSESRAISVALRMIRKHRPDIEWVISYADGTQCGDGTIYRASGAILTGIKKNTTMLQMPDGTVMADLALNQKVINGQRGAAAAKKAGAKPLPGCQLRYIFFLNPKARSRLTVPELPYSDIERLGARMYKGKRVKRSSDAADFQLAEGGAEPTHTLQSSTES